MPTHNHLPFWLSTGLILTLIPCHFSHVSSRLHSFVTFCTLSTVIWVELGGWLVREQNKGNNTGSVSRLRSSWRCGRCSLLGEFYHPAEPFVLPNFRKDVFLLVCTPQPEADLFALPNYLVLCCIFHICDVSLVSPFNSPLYVNIFPWHERYRRRAHCTYCYDGWMVLTCAH